MACTSRCWNAKTPSSKCQCNCHGACHGSSAQQLRLPLFTVIVPEDLQTADERWALEFEMREMVIGR